MRENWEGQEGEREKKREEVRYSQREKERWRVLSITGSFPKCPLQGGLGQDLGTQSRFPPHLDGRNPIP